MVVSRTQVVQDEANGSLSRFKQQIKQETEALSLAVEDINAALQIRARECRAGSSDNRMQRFANVEKLTLADESLSSAPLRYPTDESREEEVRYLVERLANALPNNESVLSSLLQAAQDVSHRPLDSTQVPTRQQDRTHSTPTQSTAQLHEFARDYSRGSGSTKRFGNRESSPSTSPSKSSTTQKRPSSRPNSMVLPVTTGRSPLGSLPQTHTPPGATPAYSPSLSGKVPSSSPDMMGHGKVPRSSPDLMMHGGMRLNRRGRDSLW